MSAIDENKSKFVSKPVISSRLPEAFSKIYKKKTGNPDQKHHKNHDLDPQVAKAVKLLNKFPNYPEQDFQPEGPYSGPSANIDLEELITVSLFPNNLKGNKRKVLHSPTQKVYTVIEVPVDSLDQENYLRSWIDFWEFLQTRTKRLVRIEKVFWNEPEDTVSVLMEYLEGGSLSSILDEVASFPETVVVYIVKRLIKILKFFHDQAGSYGRLKASQVLFKKDGLVKLGLGLSKKQPSSDDIYDLGYLALQALFGDESLLQPVSKPTCCLLHSLNSNPILRKLSSESKDFLCCTLQTLPERRPSLRELKFHPWINTDTHQGPSVTLEEILSISGPSGLMF